MLRLTTYLFILSSIILSGQSWEKIHQLDNGMIFEALHSGNSTYLLNNFAGSLELYRSSNAGEKWDFGLKSGTSISPHCATLASENLIFISYGQKGDLYLIRYEPNSISEMKIESDVRITTMHHDGFSVGIAGNDLSLGGSGKEFFTTNNGWSSSKKHTTTNLKHVWCYQYKNIPRIKYSYINYLDSNSSYYNYSIDLGQTWQQHKIGDFEARKMFFLNADTGWVCGDLLFKEGKFFAYKSIIMKTTDGGESWVTQLEKSSSNMVYLSQIKFITADIGIAVSSGIEPIVFTTTDGGETWLEEKLELDGAPSPLIAGFTDDGYLIASRTNLYKRIEPILNVNESLESIRTLVHPNPTSGELSIDLQDVKTISIFNIQMQELKSISEIGTNTININELPIGTYFLNITKLNGDSYFEKVVKIE